VYGCLLPTIGAASFIISLMLSIIFIGALILITPDDIRQLSSPLPPSAQTMFLGVIESIWFRMVLLESCILNILYKCWQMLLEPLENLFTWQRRELTFLEWLLRYKIGIAVCSMPVLVYGYHKRADLTLF
jgi:hypothetical protein